jgi:hypothetical protein
VSTATTGPPARRRPPDRYDPPSRLVPRFLAVVLSVLFLGLLVAVAVNLYDRYRTSDVATQERGFVVVSDQRVDVVFDVRSPEDQTAWCLVRARSADGAEVGALFVSITRKPADPQPLRLQQPLETSARAVTGEVVRCLTSTPPAGEPRAEAVRLSDP